MCRFTHPPDAERCHEPGLDKGQPGRRPHLAIQAKADKLDARNIRPVAADAETLDAEPGHFELAVIGSAFHRLDRDLVAARLLRS